MTRLVNVKTFKTTIGRACMHCRKSATVTAERVYPNKKRMPVRYCSDHHQEAVARLSKES